MELTFKNISIKALACSIIALSISCSDVDDIADGAQTGGRVDMISTQVSYLAGEESQIGIRVHENSKIESVEFYRSYSQAVEVDGVEEELWSNEVLDKTFDITPEEGEFTYALDFAALRKDLAIGGAPFATDDTQLAIGDYWNFRVVSVMEDGRRIENAVKIKVVVSNPYSGVYEASGVLHHPVSGDLAISGERTLTPVSPNSSETIVGYFENPDYLLTITVNPDNSITIGGDVAGSAVVNDPTYGTSHYDPASGELRLFYTYNTAAPRRLVEVLKPKK